MICSHLTPWARRRPRTASALTLALVFVFGFLIRFHPYYILKTNWHPFLSSALRNQYRNTIIGSISSNDVFYAEKRDPPHIKLREQKSFSFYPDKNTQFSFYEHSLGVDTNNVELLVYAEHLSRRSFWETIRETLSWTLIEGGVTGWEGEAVEIGYLLLRSDGSPPSLLHREIIATVDDPGIYSYYMKHSSGLGFPRVMVPMINSRAGKLEMCQSFDWVGAYSESDSTGAYWDNATVVWHEYPMTSPYPDAWNALPVLKDSGDPNAWHVSRIDIQNAQPAGRPDWDQLLLRQFQAACRNLPPEAPETSETIEPTGIPGT